MSLLRHHRLLLPDSDQGRDPGIRNRCIPTLYADTRDIWHNYNTSLSDRNKNTADKNNRLSHRNPDRLQRQPRRYNHNADTGLRGNREDSNPNRHRHLHRRDRCLIWSSSPPTTWSSNNDHTAPLRHVRLILNASWPANGLTNGRPYSRRLSRTHLPAWSRKPGR